MENKRIQWYMITTVSGNEEKVIESLRNRVRSEKMENLFSVEDMHVMIVPHITDKELAKKNAGEAFKIKDRNLFPGYIFVKMDMTNEAWFLVRNTQYVTGLVGSSGQRTKPTPVSERKLQTILQQVKDIKAEFADGKIPSGYNEGDIVDVIDGPMKGSTGPILSFDDDREVAVVELIQFERKTPTEIPYANFKLRK